MCFDHRIALPSLVAVEINALLNVDVDPPKIWSLDAPELTSLSPRQASSFVVRQLCNSSVIVHHNSSSDLFYANRDAPSLFSGAFQHLRAVNVYI